MVCCDDFVANRTCYYEYDDAGNIVSCEERDIESFDILNSYEYEYTDGKLTSFDGEIISYDSSGRTVYYRGKNITYFDEDANAIKSIGNVSFTYNADGLRRSKTVNGVTHYYYYDGINLVKEEWGDNILVFFYDVNGSPVGMQYRDLSDTDGDWETYLYEKNLQGDIMAVYDTSSTRLVSYTYDAWGRIQSTYCSNGGANTSAVHNPFRYRGYYYDTDLNLYYLATRYYDPEVRRFVTADSYVSTGQGILGHNRYAYCGNNPVFRIDVYGYFWESIYDVITLGASIIEVAHNPTDPLNWAILGGDFADLIPCVSCVGESIRAVKVATDTVDASKDVIAAAKVFRLTNDVAKLARTQYGSYEIIFESGYIYVGKGSFDRAIFSAKQKVIHFQDEAEAIRWKSSVDNREAFIDEYLMQDNYGIFEQSSNVDSYNEIWSPGRKYFYE